MFLFAISILVMTFQACKNSSRVGFKKDGLLKADVGEGKVIFMRDCTRCHEEKKIENFTSEQWSISLPRMIILANLNETQSRQVTTYVDWELKNKK